ncbi:hypothetical protein EUX98_g4671 [Antrodiella citrinella]|uniref:Restriction of telomere capping protein 4 n=1 Tax=Antrodiella citrinella TaxID=2447956 RepID=A0A4S4MUB7_9APHY|nr:hypothetical protein EUX98_g4671 [Antrodiella citrinella]
MEKVYDTQKRNGTNLQTDNQMRSNTRPFVPSSRTQPIKGRFMEDLGSDFGARAGGSRSSGNETRGTGRPQGGSAKKAGEDSMNDSFDFDAFNTSRDELDGLPPAPAKKGKWDNASNRLKAARAEDFAVVQGQSHEYHPDYKPTRAKFPKFKKNKPKQDAPSDVSTPTSNTSQEVIVDGEIYRHRPETLAPAGSQNHVQPSLAGKAEAIQAARNTTLTRKFKSPLVDPSARSAPSGPIASSSRTPVLAVLDKIAHPSAVRECNTNEIKRRPPSPRPFPFSEDKTPRPPKTRAVGAKADKVQDTLTSPSPLSEKTPQARPRLRPRPVTRKAEDAPIDFALSTDNDNDKMGKGKGKAMARPFPMELGSPKALSSTLSIKKSKSSKRNIKEFPMLSPPSKPTGSRPQRSKARNCVFSSSEPEESSEDEKPKKPAIRAFPMENADAGEHAWVTVSGKESIGDASPGAADEGEVFDRDLHFFDPRIDPSTLCPWCDEPLPAAPSPFLTTLIAAVRRKSHRDPRPTNPQGLWTTPTVYAHVCARHAFEEEHIPMAECNGWPTCIQWSELADRIVALKSQLQAIIDDVDEDFLSSDKQQEEKADAVGEPPVDDDYEDEELQKVRPRKGSVFWRDVVKNVKEQGSKQASGVRGQFSNFDKTQPGYYGELGYVILSQTIYDLFPPSTFDSDSTLPLIPNEFIQLILIPEAALALIMDDMSQSRKLSIRTLRESAEYGVAMFPDEGGTNVGENIVRQRAKNRRKELGDESQADDDRMESESTLSETGAAKAKGKRRGRPPKKPQSVAESSGGESRASSRSRPSRKPAYGGATKPVIKPTMLKRTTSEQQDVIMISDSAESVPSAPSQNKPRPTRKPKPRTASISTLNYSASRESVDLCDSSDDAKAVKVSLSQPYGGASSSEKENFHKGSDTDPDGADDDVQEVPPSSSMMREVTWDPKGNYHIKDPRLSSAAPSDVDTTPKKTAKRAFSRTSSSSSVVSGPSGSVIPLDIARKRSAAESSKLVIEKVRKPLAEDNDGWVKGMHDALSDDDFL